MATSRYNRFRTVKSFVGDPRRLETFPAISLNEISTIPHTIIKFKESDRLDNLAFQFYGDVSLWWIIAITNPDTVNFSSLFLPIGTQIRIPQEISPIIDGYNSINR